MPTESHKLPDLPDKPPVLFSNNPENNTGIAAPPVINHAPTEQPNQESFETPIEEEINSEILGEPQQPTYVNTQVKDTDGLNKCPSCGSSEITYLIPEASLKCNYCKNMWNEKYLEEVNEISSDITQLKGRIIGSAAKNITTQDDTITIKCQGCGAEIILQTSENRQTRCHWCRQTLSLNTQVPNGAVPDGIIPFTIEHSTAVTNINEFVNKRRMFATKKFKKEFIPENIVGVYLPYMVVDGHFNANINGIGEILTRRYTVTVGSGDNARQEPRYDADEYQINRKFGFAMDDLIVESSEQRGNFDTATNTNNVINAVLPFDIKKARIYNSNYMSAFTSEKRDMDIEKIDESKVLGQLDSIVRVKATEAATQYDRGIRWDKAEVQEHSTRWTTVYLPVWLYSSYEPNNHGEPTIHHIAVNGQTGETMGSIPINKIGLTAFSIAVGLPLLVPAGFIAFANSF